MGPTKGKRTSRIQIFKAILIVISLFLLDRYFKYLAVKIMSNGFFIMGRSIGFSLSKNIGISFSINLPLMVSIPVTLVFLAYLCWLLYCTWQNKNSYRFLIIFIIITGGLSNLFDRLFLGYVIDYVMINWPIGGLIFNLADMLVVLGVILLMFDVLNKKMVVATAQMIIQLNQDTYNSISRDFSHTRTKPLWKEVIDFKQYIKPCSRVLDLGCGNGRLLQLFDGMQANYTGVDNSSELLKRAKARIKDQGINNNKNRECIKFIKANMLKLPFEADQFDVVFMIASLNHLPAQYHIQVLTKVYQLLKSGGFLMMTNFNLWKLSLKGKTVWYYKLIKRTNSALGDAIAIQLSFKDVITLWHQKPLYYYAFTLKELRKMCQKIGFKVVASAYYHHGERAFWWNASNLVVICKK